MFASFSTALSGLNADSAAIDVIGNNLANMNTTGYKASVVSFYDMVSESIGTSQAQIGVAPPIVFRQYSQGALQNTSGPLDAAIQGDGFFVVNSNANGTQYTRAGSFQVDQNGYLITPTGERVQGWTEQSGVLNTNALPSDVVVPIGSISVPLATTSMSFDMNLNAGGTAGTTGGTFSTALKVYDSLGASHVVTATFTKSTTSGQWDYAITVPDSDLTSAFAPVTGNITFDSSGKLLTPAVTDTPPQIAVQGFADGAADMSFTWNLYDATTPRITQYSQASAASGNSQDGSATAQLTGAGIGPGGQIIAKYSNGQEQTVGQLAMALVRNPQSLVDTGNNNFRLSGLTALPAVGVPGTGGRGTVTGGSLESSTVDIAREFTNLIVFQRGYQANAKVVTTLDELSQDTINLKR